MHYAKLRKLRNDKKKYIVIISGVKIKFGSQGYQDYTMHKDKSRRKRYLLRHKNENWHNIYTAGFWSRWLLWNKKTIKQSKEYLSKHFKILFL